jgi:hypothetical protein
MHIYEYSPEPYSPGPNGAATPDGDGGGDDQVVGDAANHAANRAVSYDDFAAMDDTALIRWRTRAREELQRLPPHSLEHAMLSARYQLSTTEIDARALEARSRASHNHT